MTDAELIDKLKADLGDRVEIANPARRRLFLKVAPGDLVAGTTRLRDAYGVVLLSTISGVDLGTAFEIIYHFSTPEHDFNLRTEIPRDDPRVATITTVIPGAILYEREVQDMFGIVVDGIPDGRRLLLSDDWPEGQHPLRKDWTHDRPKEVIPGGQS
ncbi:MAG: NADH-quinone oxidoreductase subunit C [Candidatus Aminicenantes bacterium]|nr:NADH-quinone oxidoreductase subunit C [Candidatus Aminicenantes bacterium]